MNGKYRVIKFANKKKADKTSKNDLAYCSGS